MTKTGPGNEHFPADTTDLGSSSAVTPRMIDVWFPCMEVDAAVLKPAGSGLSEKALFTWFASRPIAQARAAVLCSLLPDTDGNRHDVRSAVLTGNADVMARLQEKIKAEYNGQSPVVLDMFSGRGIIPLEAARAGAFAVGLDLSPVATLAGRLLSDFPLRDWRDEPPLPFAQTHLAETSNGGAASTNRPKSKAEAEAVAMFDGMEAVDVEPRLLADVRRVLAEVGRRVRHEVAALYPSLDEAGGAIPWAYYWAVTIPCDGCGRRFPLLGSMVLRYPYARTGDIGQSVLISTSNDEWHAEVVDGPPPQLPTFRSAEGKRGKSARCPFDSCGHPHSLDVVKAKGVAGQYEDAMIAVGEVPPEGGKAFRAPTSREVDAAAGAAFVQLADIGGLPAIPDEPIPATAGVDARQYGFRTYGSLMNRRQSVLFATTARVIRDLYSELLSIVSREYAEVLVCYAAGNLPRQLRRATRGSDLHQYGKPAGNKSNTVTAGDIFSSQSIIKHQFDYVEAGPGEGPGTWNSVSTSMVNALKKVLAEGIAVAAPARIRRASATALPLRDHTVDALVTDPPYYTMIAYADSSDLFFVWLRRALGGIVPDLFESGVCGEDGLQDKAQEIIVKGRGAKGHGDHRTEEFYESMLATSFTEAKRVLKTNGHLTVIFGHADPDAWKRLLAALSDAGFVVTSSWPSRTETTATGVATISVTVSIGARVAPQGRPIGIAAQVDAEVVDEVKMRCRGWDSDGLALEDQLMASYGAALQVVGQYERVITPDGATVPLEHYMTLSRRAVRDAVALRLGEQPLETFDPFTRLAVFWNETYGRSEVPKGEARFFAQSDSLRLEDLRGPILEESNAGFHLRHDAPDQITPASSAYEVVRAMAAAQPAGTEAVAAQLCCADRPATDAHVWALVDWLAAKLPSSDPVAVSLAAIKRNSGIIQKIAAGQAKQASEVQTVAQFEEAP